MKFKRLWKIYFSPTGTTKKCADFISKGLLKEYEDNIEIMEYDFTLPLARESFPKLNEEDMVVFGCPTYAGRLPNLMLSYLNTIEGNGAYAIAFVTFGNRNYDNSLIELYDILINHGFNVKGGAALSCEHSFSKTLGAGRPDERDRAEMIDFAAKFVKKSHNTSPLHITGKTSDQNYGGYYQPRDRHSNPIDIRKVKPLTDTIKCTDCKVCVNVCPMGSIDANDVSKVTGVCIKCCACEKNCPVGAKYYDDKNYLYHKKELEDVYTNRAENAFFI